MLGAGRVGDFGLVAGEQRLQAAARVRGPGEIDAGKAVQVTRLADFGSMMSATSSRLLRRNEVSHWPRPSANFCDASAFAWIRLSPSS